jgi:flagellar protein FlgJ
MQAAALYNDFGTLADLRTDARRDAEASLREVAGQFEALFVQMMLKSMRDAVPEGGLFESNHLDTYEQMYDQQLSLELSNRGGIGLADTIVEQLRKAAPANGASDAAEAGLMPLPRRGDASAPAMPLSPSPPAAMPLEAARLPRAEAPAAGFESPADFVKTLRPLAERAARRLGVEADVLLAQAALETGWGQHVTADRSGSSNNLFNIKAGGSWSGSTVTVGTVEYRRGVAVRESAAFRAYDSLEAAFSDYVSFIEGSPRYQAALEKAGDGEAYLRELQAAGYATDPQYADKILSIMERRELRAAARG